MNKRKGPGPFGLRCARSPPAGIRLPSAQTRRREGGGLNRPEEKAQKKRSDPSEPRPSGSQSSSRRCTGPSHRPSSRRDACTFARAGSSLFAVSEAAPLTAPPTA